MPVFGSKSRAQLETCDVRLQRIANEAIKYVDFMILEGHRGKERQNHAFDTGASKVRWPKGNHNRKPSRAFDFAPFPLDWSDKIKALVRFTFVAGAIWVAALKLGIKIRFGWDWNRNLDPRDDSFMDWGHVELDEP